MRSRAAHTAVCRCQRAVRFPHLVRKYYVEGRQNRPVSSRLVLQFWRRTHVPCKPGVVGSVCQAESDPRPWRGSGVSEDRFLC